MTALKIIKAISLVAMLASISACGRAGEPVKPSAAVIDGEKVYPDAKPQEDKPFILDGLLN